MSAKKLGRRQPHSPTTHPRLQLRRFLRDDQFPVTPTSIDWTTRVAEWPMYLNDELGCCTVAAAGHMTQAWTTYGAGHTATVADSEILTAYQAVSGYIPGQPDTDQGAVMQDVLDYWRKTGVGGHKILAFAEVDVRDMAEVYAALYLFGHVYVGVNLPYAALDQFDAGQPWQVADDDGGLAGGHAVDVGWRNGTAMKAITWGRTQMLDEAWWRSYVEEAWVVCSTEWLTETGGGPQGLDLAALGTAYTQLTGQPSPFPAPPPDADHMLAAALKPWAAATHVGTNARAAAAFKTWLKAKNL